MFNSRIKRFDNFVQAVGNRWQAYGGFVAFVLFVGAVIGAALNWSRPFFPDAWGWPEAIVLGIAAACILILVVSFALIAWRYFFQNGKNITARETTSTIALTGVQPNIVSARLEASAVPIFEVVIHPPNYHQDPSLWLRFQCTSFNGTPENLVLNSADGRIRIAQATFLHRIELEKWNGVVYPYSFFTFVLQLPLTTAESGHFLDLMESDYIKIIFQDIELLVTTELGGTKIRTPISGAVQFKKERKTFKASLVGKCFHLQYSD